MAGRTRLEEVEGRKRYEQKRSLSKHIYLKKRRHIFWHLSHGYDVTVGNNNVMHSGDSREGEREKERERERHTVVVMMRNSTDLLASYVSVSVGFCLFVCLNACLACFSSVQYM